MIFQRSHACFIFEALAKMALRAKSQRVRHHRKPNVLRDQLFCLLDTHFTNAFRYGDPHFPLEKRREMASVIPRCRRDIRNDQFIIQIILDIPHRALYGGRKSASDRRSPHSLRKFQRHFVVHLRDLRNGSAAVRAADKNIAQGVRLLLRHSRGNASARYYGAVRHKMIYGVADGIVRQAALFRAAVRFGGVLPPKLQYTLDVPRGHHIVKLPFLSIRRVREPVFPPKP